VNDLVITVIIALLLANLIGLLWLGQRASGQSNENRSLSDRLTHLEAKVNTMPTHRDLAELREDFSEVAETTAALSGQMTTVLQLLRTIQDHLLEND
jgi:uncharacterized membrane protein YfbV (UPF0208 family)